MNRVQVQSKEIVMRRSRQLPGERALKDGGQAPVSFGELVRGWLAGKGQDPRREHLEQLWRNWSIFSMSLCKGRCTVPEFGFQASVALIRAVPEGPAEMFA